MNISRYPLAVWAFLEAVSKEQAVCGVRLRDLLTEHYPGNGAASDSGHSLLAELHQTGALGPVHRHPSVLETAPDRDSELWRSAMAFQTLQYGRKPGAALAMKGDEIPAGSHELYTWAPGPAFPHAELRERHKAGSRGWYAWAKAWTSEERDAQGFRLRTCFGGGKAGRKVHAAWVHEDGLGYCDVCSGSAPMRDDGRTIKHLCVDLHDRIDPAARPLALEALCATLADPKDAERVLDEALTAGWALDEVAARPGDVAREISSV